MHLLIPASKKCERDAFSLVEILAALGIISIILAVSGPSLVSIFRASNVNQAAADLSGLLENARNHAMCHQTHVRVAIADTASGSREGVLVVALVPMDGVPGSSAADMADPTKWRTLGKPLELRNLQLRDTLNAQAFDTSQDAVPSQSDITEGQALTREIQGRGAVGFDSFIQLNPDGRATVMKDLPSRHIKVVLDRRGPEASMNPVLLRISGANGCASVFRSGTGL